MYLRPSRAQTTHAGAAFHSRTIFTGKGSRIAASALMVSRPPSSRRAKSEAAWAHILPRCTDADFAEHRYQRAFVKWKYQIWSEGYKMPTQTVRGMSKCFCGAIINNKTSGDHVRARHMEKKMAISMFDQMLFPLECGHDVVLGRLANTETWVCEKCGKAR
jgi:hypothetical protein